MNTTTTSFLLLVLARLYPIARYDQAESPHSRTADPNNLMNPSRVIAGKFNHAGNHSDSGIRYLSRCCKSSLQTTGIPLPGQRKLPQATQTVAYSNHSMQREYVNHIAHKHAPGINMGVDIMHFAALNRSLTG